MRLTLRTLLAYLDDALPPAEAREIGQKVAESPVAKELMDRIKKVTRRRSLVNPSLYGESSKLDPNTVADYIDGQLSPEEVEQVDVTCLSEDVYLAEVAACHQILTLMMSEPALVPPSARQRMYQLVKGPESIPFRRPPAAVERKTPDRFNAQDAPRSVRWPWYVAGIVVASLGLATAIWQAWPTDAVPPHRSAEHVNLALFVPPAVPAPKGPDPTPANNERKLPLAPPPKEIDPNRKVDPKDASTVGAPKKPIDQPSVAAPSRERKEVGRLSSANAILLTPLDEPQKGWQRLLRGNRIVTQTPVMSLPAFRNEVQLDTGVHVMLWGSVPEFQGPPTFECSVTFHAPPAGIEADLTVHRGRVVFQNNKPNGAASLRLRFHREVWEVTLSEKAEILADVEVSYSPGVRFSKDPGGDEPTVRVFIGVPKGSATLKIGFQKPLELNAPPGPALVGWDSKGGAVRETIRLREILPVWSPALPDHQAARDMAKARDELGQQLIKRDASVGIILTELSAEPVPTFQVLAVFTLGAIESLTDLLDAMDDAEKPIARGAAIFALRHWCARHADNDRRLHQMLQSNKNYSEEQADQVLQLLHFLSEADLQQPSTYTALFAHMQSAKLSIRELAFSHLAQVDPDGAKQALFNPAGSDAEREAAVARWRRRIPEGKLPPRPAGLPK